MKAQDFILVALICASATLAGLLIATQVGTLTPPKAHAQTTDRSGDYIITTGLINVNTEGVLIIDTVSQRAIFYLYDQTARKFVPMRKAARDLAKDFGPRPRS
ncbi:MAG: hypothetical protein QF662_02860 [Phycisphaerae bacterium]|nr:hypothetical protein [Phycisphaerae bacterium]